MNEIERENERKTLELLNRVRTDKYFDIAVCASMRLNEFMAVKVCNSLSELTTAIQSKGIDGWTISTKDDNDDGRSIVSFMPNPADIEKRFTFINGDELFKLKSTGNYYLSVADDSMPSRPVFEYEVDPGINDILDDMPLESPTIQNEIYKLVIDGNNYTKRYLVDVCTNIETGKWALIRFRMPKLITEVKKRERPSKDKKLVKVRKVKK